MIQAGHTCHISDLTALRRHPAPVARCLVAMVTTRLLALGREAGRAN